MRSMLLYVYGIWINVLGVQCTFSNFCTFGSSFAQLVAVNTHYRGATINRTPFNASLTSNSKRPNSKHEMTPQSYVKCSTVLYHKNHNYNCHHITFPLRSKCKCHQSLVIKWTPAVINQTAVIVGAATMRAREGYCYKVSCHEKCSPCLALNKVVEWLPSGTINFDRGNSRQ